MMLINNLNEFLTIFLKIFSKVMGNKSNISILNINIYMNHNFFRCSVFFSYLFGCHGAWVVLDGFDAFLNAPVCRACAVKVAQLDDSPTVTPPFHFSSQQFPLFLRF